MFGKFAPGAVKEISAERTKKSVAIIESCGGKGKALYALLGETEYWPLPTSQLLSRQ